jgi:hypothetical protein
MVGERMNSRTLEASSAAVRSDIGLLPLPMPGEPFTTGTGGLGQKLATGALCVPDTDAGHAHFRWLLGHQVAFCVWLRLADVLARMIDEGVRKTLLDEAAQWYDRYAAMFVYAGSCGEPMYRKAVRTSMIAVHPGFSGVWARDYVRVLQLLHELHLPADSSLRCAVKRNRLVHMRIAKILVPEGESLLKESGHRSAGEAVREAEDLFDRYFLVRRGAVGEDVFRGQAVRRAVAVLSDLEQHPIELPELAPAVAALPDDIVTLVRETVSAFSAPVLGDRS